MTVDHAMETPVAPDKAACFFALWRKARAAASPLSGHPAHFRTRSIASAVGLPEEEVLRRCALALGVPFVRDVRDFRPDPEFIKGFTSRFAKSIPAIAAYDSEGARLLLTGEPFAQGALTEVGMTLGENLPPALTTPSNVFALITQAYRGEVEEQADNVATTGDDVSDLVKNLVSSRDLLDFSNTAPVARLVTEVLFRASRLRASDVHLQPGESGIAVRFRIDGLLHDILSLPAEAHRAIVARIKIMSGMDIAETRVPQDGRTTVTSGSARYDLRVATVPTVWGERVVIRILDKSRDLIDLYTLGLAQPDIDFLLGVAARTSGMILVAGPTGSGKTTTLYALISRIDVAARNVITIEDPVEYQIPGISQIQVNSKADVRFANALRGILRQDPDVIYVGEIRDADTATIAMRAALTGHMVFSTIHTIDAAAAVTRLVDIGADPYLVAAGLTATVAQRLVRTLCPSCREDRPLSTLEAEVFSSAGVTPPANVSFGRGCGMCMGTGFLGRRAIFEIIEVNPVVRTMILHKSAATEISKHCREQGSMSLRQGGLKMVSEGVTTLEEVLAVTEKES